MLKFGIRYGCSAQCCRKQQPKKCKGKMKFHGARTVLTLDLEDKAI